MFNSIQSNTLLHKQHRSIEQISRQRTQLVPSSGHRKLTPKRGTTHVNPKWVHVQSTHGQAQLELFVKHVATVGWVQCWQPSGTNKAVHKRPSSPIETFVKHVAKMSWVPCGDPMLDPQTVHKGPS